MNHKTDIREALQLCIDVMLHDGVPTDPEHPKRIALAAAEAALASQPAGVPEDIAEGLEILDNFIASVRENGSYSTEATLTFIGQARQCFAAAPAPVSEPEQPSQDEASLCERIIHAVEGECDGLAITEEQASNILAYLQYGAPMCDMPEAFHIVDNAIGAAEEYEPEGGNLRIVTLRIDAARKVRAALASQTAEQPSERGEPGAPPSADHIADDRKLVDAVSAPTFVQCSDELTPRTPGEKAAYLEGIEEGRMRAVRDGQASAPTFGDVQFETHVLHIADDIFPVGEPPSHVHVVELGNRIRTALSETESAAFDAIMRACDAREISIVGTSAELIDRIIKWELDEAPTQQPQAAEPKGMSEGPSFANPLTPYGMLVRALRIVAGTTLYDMAQALLTTPAKLSAMEFGRAPVTQEFAFDVAAYFDALGVPGTLAALKVAANARALLAKGE